MINVRVWNLASHRDARAVKFLENEFLRYRRLAYLAIRTTGRGALGKCHRKGATLKDSLKKAIQHYLKQDDYIIFVTDPDQREPLAPESLVEQIRRVVEDGDFSDKVFFVPDIQESGDAIPTEWQRIVSRFRTEVESERERFREEWDRTVAHFHNACADIPEEEVIRHFEEALAEVRREYTETADIHK